MISLRIAPLLLLFALPAAKADWATPEVAYRCDMKQGTFSMAGVVDTDSADAKVPLMAGYRKASNRGNSKIRCKLGPTVIVVQLRLFPARERGICSAADMYDIALMTINGKQVFAYEKFNNVCGVADPALYQIDYRQDTGLLHSCRGKWESDVGYEDSVCKDEFPASK